jgi:hypothetical protein
LTQIGFGSIIHTSQQGVDMKKALIVALMMVVCSAWADTETECITKGKAYENEAGVTVKPSVETRCKRTPGAFAYFKPFCVDLTRRAEIRKEYSKNPGLLRSLEVEWKKADKKYPKCA